MAINEIYAGVDQVDLATLTSGGVTYHCEAWIGRDGQRVEAKIIAEGEGGAMVLIDAAVVDVPGGSDDFVDCARVLPIPGTSIFALHWAAYEDSAPTFASHLHRALFDVTAIPTGWVLQGAVVQYVTSQYDAYPVEGSSGASAGFVVVRRTAADTIQIDRFDAPFSWVDTAYASVTIAGLTIENTILGCWAHEADNVILVGYQHGTTMRVRRHVASTGLAGSTGVVFSGLDSGANQFSAVGFERLASGSYAVVCEANSNANHVAAGDRLYLRMVGWCSIDSTVATTGGPDCVKNVSMASRPWVTASGYTATVDLFVAAAFKSVDDGQEYDQQYGYVLRLPIGPTGDGAGQVRAIPHSAIMDGSFDARPHGMSPYTALGSVLSIGARINHVSSVGGPPQYTLGPNVKTRIFGCVRWGRYKIDGATAELVPVEAGAGYVRFHYEPGWTIRRDALEPTQPDTPAWKNASKALSLPLETPAGLMLTGGVAQAYDGEQLVEAGFMWAPEIMQIDVSGGMSGEMDDALTYHWYANYIWPDNAGGIHRGGPSRPQSAAVPVDEYATLRIRCCNLSLKDDTARYPAAHPIGIEVWRTYAVGGSLVQDDDVAQTYLFRSDLGTSGTAPAAIQSTPSSDPGEWYVEVVAGRPNSEVALNELAPYQLDLDALQWVPPPPIPHQPLGHSCVWQNRVFGQDPATGSLVWSEEILPIGSRFTWPYFLDTNVFRLDGLGEVTAVCPLEDDLAIFTRDGVYLMSGDPGAGGSGNTFVLRIVARGIGCIEPRSIAAFTDGLTFQSAKGRIHVLTRGAGIEDIGGPIEDLLGDAGNVRGAVYVEDRDEIRFALQEEPGVGPLVVRPRVALFNLRTKIWCIRNLPMLASSSTASRLNELTHALPWRGRMGETVLVLLAQGAGLAIERAATSTVYSDETASGPAEAIRLDITTEWIHMGLPDTTKRYPEIGVVTERVNAGPLTIESWYDHDGSFDSDSGTSEYTLTVASPAPAFIRFRPVPPKCRAIKLRIYEPSGAPATENVRYVAVVMHYALLPKRQGSRNSAT